MKKLLTIVVLGLLLSGNAYAGFLGKDGIQANIYACKAQQKQRPINKNIEEAKINKYCECYVNKFDNSLTQSDAKYYKANGRFPDSIRAKVFEASKTCALKILNRKE
tara:strand:+ start:328 stop:648 length:321 start_codon:yes stop_codon:yes gene_type:complete